MHELRSSSCTGVVQSGVYSHLRPNDFHFLSWLFCVCRVLRLLGFNYTHESFKRMQRTTQKSARFEGTILRVESTNAQCI